MNFFRRLGVDRINKSHAQTFSQTYFKRISYNAKGRTKLRMKNVKVVIPARLQNNRIWGKNDARSRVLVLKFITIQRLDSWHRSEINPQLWNLIFPISRKASVSEPLLDLRNELLYGHDWGDF